VLALGIPSSLESVEIPSPVNSNQKIVYATTSTGRAKEFCPFCPKKAFKKLRSHLLSSVHSEEREILLYHASQSVEAKRIILSSLRQQGYEKHNLEVMQSGTGVLFPKKRNKSDDRDCKMCMSCKSLINTASFYMHSANCLGNPEARSGGNAAPSIGLKVETVALSMEFNVEKMTLDMKVLYKNSLSGLRDKSGAILKFIMRDELCCRALVTIHFQQNYKNSGEQTTRNKCRTIFRIIRFFQTNVDSSIKTVLELIQPKYLIDEMLSCFRSIIGYNPETKTFKNDTAAMTLNSLLRVLGNTALNIGVMRNDRSIIENATQFVLMLSQDYWKSRTVTLASQHRLTQKPKNPKQVIPEDLQKYNLLNEAKMEESHTQAALLSSEEFRKWFRLLVGFVGTRLSSFSARRLGEVQRALTTDWTNRTEPFDKANESLMNPRQLEIANAFQIFYVNGKKGQLV
jgi:hypothetical protein